MDAARMALPEIVDGLIERGKSRLGLRGEELERDGGFTQSDNFVNPHGRSSMSDEVVGFHYRGYRQKAGRMCREVAKARRGTRRREKLIRFYFHCFHFHRNLS